MRKASKTVKSVVGSDTPDFLENLVGRTEKTETIPTKMTLALINNITNVLSEGSGIDMYFYTSEKASFATDSLFVYKIIPDYLFDAPISKISFGHLKMNVEIRDIDEQIIKNIRKTWILENSNIPDLKSKISSIRTDLDKFTNLYKASGMTKIDYDKFMMQLKETGIVKTQADYSEILKLKASLKDYNKELNDKCAKLTRYTYNIKTYFNVDKDKRADTLKTLVWD